MQHYFFGPWLKPWFSRKAIHFLRGNEGVDCFGIKKHLNMRRYSKLLKAAHSVPNKLLITLATCIFVFQWLYDLLSRSSSDSLFKFNELSNQQLTGGHQSLVRGLGAGNQTALTWSVLKGYAPNQAWHATALAWFVNNSTRHILYHSQPTTTSTTFVLHSWCSFLFSFITLRLSTSTRVLARQQKLNLMSHSSYRCTP